MDNCYMPISGVPVGEKARILRLQNRGGNRRRFLDLGLIPGTVVEVLFKSPAQNPVAYKIRGAVIALRNEDAADIIVQII